MKIGIKLKLNYEFILKRRMRTRKHKLKSICFNLLLEGKFPPGDDFLYKTFKFFKSLSAIAEDEGRF